jgi:biotin-dependent carboxylase-like uncharacterized protein
MTTLQDSGRFGMLAHGVCASGPMDGRSYAMAGALLSVAGATAVEFSQGVAVRADEPVAVAAAGADFRATLDGTLLDWPAVVTLKAGDKLEITPGASGNYGYLRFDREIDVPLVLGSRSTNVVVGLGGFKGRALKAGDGLPLGGPGVPSSVAIPGRYDGPIRVIWGIHAELFEPGVRQRFTETAFKISQNLDRMGVRLSDPAGIFAGQRRLNLVSDAIVPGDIQILGDGTPTVLMRDHQPTGGYPRVATMVTADLDRFAQLRPGAEVRFQPVTLDHAR